jgi:hypothetical protein
VTMSTCNLHVLIFSKKKAGYDKVKTASRALLFDISSDDILLMKHVDFFKTRGDMSKT